MRQRAAARMLAGVLFEERKIAPLEKKKQQQVRARHRAAGMCRLPQRRNECYHEPLAGIERVLILNQ